MDFVDRVGGHPAPNAKPEARQRSSAWRMPNGASARSAILVARPGGSVDDAAVQKHVKAYAIRA